MYLKYIHNWKIIAFLGCLLTHINMQAVEMAKLTKENGLVNNSIEAIYKDSRGIVFIGTSQGLDIFNGLDVYNTPFPENCNKEDRWVKCIAEDKKGHIYVGCTSGLWGIDRQTLSMKRLYEDDITEQVNELHIAADGTIYIGTAKGLFAKKGNKLKQLPVYEKGGAEVNITDIALQEKDNQTIVWTLTRKGLIKLLPASGKGGQLRPLPSNAGRYCSRVAVANGRIFVGTHGGGLLTHDAATGKYSKYLFDDDDITSLTVSGNDLLIGTYRNGAMVVSTVNDSITRTYTNAPSKGKNIRVRNNEANIFYRDRDGDDWIGYIFYGIDYTTVASSVFQRFPLYQPEPLVRCCYVNGRLTVAGTDNGLLHINADGNITPFDGQLAHVRAVQIFPHGNRLYIATVGQGVRIIDKTTKQPVENNDLDKLKRENVYVITADQQSRVWMGTTAGLVCYDPDTGSTRIYDTTNSSLPHNETFCVCFDNGGTGWVSTRGGTAMLQHNGTLNTIYVPKEIKDLGWIRQMQSIGEKMFFVPQHGFPMAYNITNGTAETIKMDVESENPEPKFFMPLDTNKYLLCTEDGLFVGNSTTRRKFGFIDGLASQLFVPRSCQRDSAGTLWIGTAEGLMYAKVNDLLKTDYPHRDIHIFSIFNDYEWSKAEVYKSVNDRRITLSRNSGELVMIISPLVYCSSQQLDCKYKIGEDGTWINIPGNREIILGKLWPGEHKLYLQAIGKPEICSEYIIDVPLRYSQIYVLAALMLGLMAAFYMAWCQAYGKEYFWKRLITPRQKYVKNKIDDKGAQKQMKMLDEYMETKKPYLNTDLTLTQLSQAIGISSHALSQIFTQVAGRTYYDYIAEYRIKEFKRRITVSIR